MPEVYRGEEMNNPWNDISLSDYENHMRLDSVAQLQKLNSVMCSQFGHFPAESVMILGIAGGNGLEHIDPVKYKKVFGVDINSSYLDETAKRYPFPDGVLELICADLTAETDKLPHADLIIADLIIEYLGYDCFEKVITQVEPKFISCVTQVDTGNDFVSVSPYLHSFDGLDSIHRQIDKDELAVRLGILGYSAKQIIEYPLPNGKTLVRTDFTIE